MADNFVVVVLSFLKLHIPSSLYWIEREETSNSAVPNVSLTNFSWFE
jgi:hypothetical protein